MIHVFVHALEGGVVDYNGASAEVFVGVPNSGFAVVNVSEKVLIFGVEVRFGVTEFTFFFFDQFLAIGADFGEDNFGDFSFFEALADEVALGLFAEDFDGTFGGTVAV